MSVFGEAQIVQESEVPKRITGGDLDKYFTQALKLQQGKALKIPITTTDVEILDKAGNSMNTRLSNLTDAAPASERSQWKKLHIRKDKEHFNIFLVMGEPRKPRNVKKG